MKICLEFMDPCGYVLYTADFYIPAEAALPLEGKGDIRQALPCGPNEDSRAPYSVRLVHQ